MPTSGSTVVWSAAATGTNGTSATHTVQGPHVSIFGNVSSGSSSTLTVQFSNDNSTFYDSGNTITISSTGDFEGSFGDISSKYIRVKSSANITLTLIIASRQ